MLANNHCLILSHFFPLICDVLNNAHPPSSPYPGNNLWNLWMYYLIWQKRDGRCNWESWDGGVIQGGPVESQCSLWFHLLSVARDSTGDVRMQQSKTGQDWEDVLLLALKMKRPPPKRGNGPWKLKKTRNSLPRAPSEGRPSNSLTCTW